VAFFFLLAGRLQKMSNFNVLARLAQLGSLAPARRPHPPRLRNCRLEQDKIDSDFVSKKKRKNFKELFNLNGRSGCSQLGLLQIVQSGH